MANKSITIDDAILSEIEAFAALPTEGRTLSNAVEALCRLGLERMKELGRIPSQNEKKGG